MFSTSERFPRSIQELIKLQKTEDNVSIHQKEQRNGERTQNRSRWKLEQVQPRSRACDNEQMTRHEPHGLPGKRRVARHQSSKHRSSFGKRLFFESLSVRTCAFSLIVSLASKLYNASRWLLLLLYSADATTVGSSIRSNRISMACQ